MRAKRTFAACVLVLVMMSSGGRPALAQTVPSLDLRTWRPSPDPEAGLVLEPVTTPGPWRWNVDVWGSYAQTPVVLRDAATGAVLKRPLEHALGADLVAEIGLGDRAAVGLDLPIFVWQDGTSSLPSTTVTGGVVPTTGVGDLALSGKVAIVSNDRQGIRAGPGLAALGAVTFPTGDRASFMGEGSPTVSLRVLGEYAFGVAAARATIGYTLRVDQRTWPSSGGVVRDNILGDRSGVTFGDEIPWSAGVVLRPKAIATALDADDRQEWEVALHGALPAGPVAPFGLGDPGAPSLSPVLLAVDDRIAIGGPRDVFVVWGGDFGLDEAYGVPAFRTVLGIGWAPREHDRDGDGVPDDVDQCPDLPEDRDGIQDEDGCPEDDADDDGILDTVDACPLVKGVGSDDPKKNGCPPEASRPRDPVLPRSRASPGGPRGLR
jgi:OOP family OmpA-OmpF porin